MTKTSLFRYSDSQLLDMIGSTSLRREEAETIYRDRLAGRAWKKLQEFIEQEIVPIFMQSEIRRIRRRVEEGVLGGPSFLESVTVTDSTVEIGSTPKSRRRKRKSRAKTPAPDQAEKLPAKTRKSRAKRSR